MPYNVQQPSYPAYSHAPSHGARGAPYAVRSTRCAARGARYAKVALLGHRRTASGTRVRKNTKPLLREGVQVSTNPRLGR